MPFQDNPYTPALFVNSASLFTLGLYVWLRGKNQPSTKVFAAMMFAGAWWAFAYGMNWASTNFNDGYLWFRLTYFGVAFVPVFWFSFAAQYTTRGQWFTWRNLGLLLIMPCVTVIMSLTNELHHLMWQGVTFERNLAGFTVLRNVRSVWFWIHTAYSYSLMVGGGVLIIRALIRSPHNYRGQAMPLVIGVATPWVVNAFTLAGLLPFPDLDLTPFTFTISGAAFAWSIFRYRLFDVVPVAHDVVIRTMRDGVIVLNAQQEIVDINPAAQHALQQGEAANLLLQPCAKVIPQWTSLVPALQTTVQLDTEVTLNGGGTPHPYSLRISCLQDRGGVINGYLLHLQDITKHKETQTALRQTEQLFYETVAGIHDPYYESDLSGTLLFANPAFCQTLQYEQTELVGKNFRHFVARHDVKRVFEYFSNFIKTKGAQPILNYEYRRKDGSLGFGEVSSSLIRDTQGKIIGTRGIVRDANERKRYEQALQRAKQAAEEANATKSAFLANVSHELRTPLTALLGFTKIVQKRFTEVIQPAISSPDPKVERAIHQVAENLKVVLSEGERLTKLINDVLDLSKIETSKAEWKTEVVALGNLAERALEAQRPQFKNQGLTLTAHLGSGLPTVIGNPERLTQVINNLLSNASKFTPTGDVTCKVWQNGDEVIVSVSDTGIGIAEENLEKVFDRFAQVGDTLTEKPGGTGLGLALCKHIVEQHHGRIWIESELGKGTTCSFAIPLQPPTGI